MCDSCMRCVMGHFVFIKANIINETVFFNFFYLFIAQVLMTMWFNIFSNIFHDHSGRSPSPPLTSVSATNSVCRLVGGGEEACYRFRNSPDFRPPPGVSLPLNWCFYFSSLLLLCPAHHHHHCIYVYTHYFLFSFVYAPMAFWFFFFFVSLKTKYRPLHLTFRKSRRTLLSLSLLYFSHTPHTLIHNTVYLYRFLTAATTKLIYIYIYI